MIYKNVFGKSIIGVSKIQNKEGILACRFQNTSLNLSTYKNWYLENIVHILFWIFKIWNNFGECVDVSLPVLKQNVIR